MNGFLAATLTASLAVGLKVSRYAEISWSLLLLIATVALMGFVLFPVWVRRAVARDAAQYPAFEEVTNLDYARHLHAPYDRL